MTGPGEVLSAALDDNGLASLGEDGSAALSQDGETAPTGGHGGLRSAPWRNTLVQLRVSSATAFFAQRSSTMPLPSAAAAMSADRAALLRARGMPLA